MKKASLPLVLTGLGFNPNGPRGACPPSNGRTVSDCGAYGIAELMAERKKLELGCARLLDLLPQVHGEPRPDLIPVRV